MFVVIGKREGGSRELQASSTNNPLSNSSAAHPTDLGAVSLPILIFFFSVSTQGCGDLCRLSLW